MKKTVIALLMVLTTLGASAQSLFWDSSDADKSVELGARLGWNFASLAGKGSGFYDGRKGVALGAAVNVNLIRSFSINTGLFFSMKGCSMNYEKMLDDMMGIAAKSTTAVNFFELPVYASYHLRFTSESDLQIFAGPYFGFGVYGKMGEKLRDMESYDEDKVDLFGKSKLGYHRWQSGIGLGASYTFNSHYLVGLQYQWGISDIGELLDNQWNCFQLTFGYNF